MNSNIVRRWGVAIGCALIIGCAASPPSVPVAPPLPVDEKVLLALDYFEPMYEVDAYGRDISLRLTGRHLPSPIMVEVGKLTELRGLDLYGSTLTDDGLAHLKDLKQLRSIGLGATLVTDKGLVHLEKLDNLQWVWLPSRTVTQDGIDRLKKVRPELNTQLQ